MVTPQTNITLEGMAEELLACSSFAICGHVNPDGDCIGSQLALAHALRSLGKEATCLLAKPDPVPEGLRFLPGADQLVPAKEYSGTPEAFVAVDVPTVARIGDAAAVQQRARVTFTLDHHASPTPMSKHNYIDPDAPATCELVWRVARMLNAVNEDVAQCALCGLMTDTGRFSYQNTTPESFEMAAEMVRAGASPAVVAREFYQNRSLASYQLERRMLERLEFSHDGQFVCSHLLQADMDEFGAVKSDTEVLIDELRSIRGVRVALLLKENAPWEIRGSLRAKDTMDVSAVARRFNGGGHTAAAGFTFHGSMRHALIDVSKAVDSLCFGGGAGE